MGKTLGAFFAGWLIGEGRKDVFIKFNILAFLSTLMMQHLSFGTLFVGKFINGVSVTVVNISALKMINETVPLEYMGSFGGAIQLFASLGSSIMSALGSFLPQLDYNPALSEDPDNELARQADIQDSTWRIQYGFPLLVNLWMLVSFTAFIQEDSIMFNLSQGKDSGAE